MQIKRFEAKTMTVALKLVKEEFGPDAVILSARSLRNGRGLFGVGRVLGVEVTAAKDDGRTTYTATGRPAALPSKPEADSEALHAAGRPGLFQTLNHRLRFLAGRRPAQTPAAAQRVVSSELSELHRHLLSQEVQRDLAADLIDQIKQSPGYDPLLGAERLRSQMSGILQDMGLVREVETASHAGPRIIVMVGPSGVGKTSTGIKLAALQAVRLGRKAVLLTLDDHRIGAIDQLRIYSRILGVPSAVAASAADARQALENFQEMDCMIVDTPGISPGEEMRRSELRQILDPLRPKEVHLVLSASTRERDLIRTIDAWNGFPVNRLAFTRLDEASTCGSLLNLLVRTRLPLSYLSTGPGIPGDLSETPFDWLMNRLWPAGEAPAVRQGPVLPSAREAAAPVLEGPPCFVANRNSDLYHRPGCKWALRIKDGNLIQFSSAEEAEARHFAACRNCSPDAAAGDATLRDGQRVTGCR